MCRQSTHRRAFLAASGLALTGLAGCSSALGGEGLGTTDAPGTDDRTTGSSTRTPTTAAAASGELALRAVATGFQAPLDLGVAPGSGRRYVVDQPGTIEAIDPDGPSEPFLDLRDRVVTGGERGLLGMAFHPDYAENRKLYVRYSSPRLAGTPADFSHTFVLAEFEADEDGHRVDLDSERLLLRIPEPQSNHNAGSVAFGPDGYLYVGVGDGGGAGDVGAGHAEDWYRDNPGGNGQDVTDNLLGSILRIDVDSRTGNRPYGIPADNPLVGEVGLDEHFAWGLRNPWRMSFDGEDLYVGDVGQSAYEEVDLVERGGNYGWNVMEGTHCYDASECPDRTDDGQPLLDPIIEYPHAGAPVSGISVIGGYVSGGDHLPRLDGEYVFGDLVPRGRLFAATEPSGEGLWPTRPVDVVEADRDKLDRLLSFGRDLEGRLYALGTGDEGGGVYEIKAAG